MKSVQRYLKRPLKQSERWRVEHAKMAAENAFGCTFFPHEGDSTVEIKLTNRRNPNGLLVTRSVNAPVKVERFINTDWATRNGYATR